MTKHRKVATATTSMAVLAVILIASIAMATSCSMDEADMLDARLAIALGATPRSFGFDVPQQTAVASWSYTCTSTDPGAIGVRGTLTPLPVDGDVGVVPNISAGTWTFYVEGYNSVGTRVTAGVATAFLSSRSNAITVTANVPEDDQAKGSLGATFSWRQVDNPNAHMEVAIRRFDAKTGEFGIWQSADVISDTTARDGMLYCQWDKVGVASGYYMIRAVLVNGQTQASAQIFDARVIDGVRTSDSDILMQTDPLIDVVGTIVDLSNVDIKGIVSDESAVMDSPATLTWTNTGSVVPDSYEWYVDGALVEKTTAPSFSFTPTDTRYYSIACIAFKKGAAGAGGATARVNCTRTSAVRYDVQVNVPALFEGPQGRLDAGPEASSVVTRWDLSISRPGFPLRAEVKSLSVVDGVAQVSGCYAGEYQLDLTGYTLNGTAVLSCSRIANLNSNSKPIVMDMAPILREVGKDCASVFVRCPTDLGMLTLTHHGSTSTYESQQQWTDTSAGKGYLFPAVPFADTAVTHVMLSRTDGTTTKGAIATVQVLAADATSTVLAMDMPPLSVLGQDALDKLCQPRGTIGDAVGGDIGVSRSFAWTQVGGVVPNSYKWTVSDGVSEVLVQDGPSAKLEVKANALGLGEYTVRCIATNTDLGLAGTAQAQMSLDTDDKLAASVASFSLSRSTATISKSAMALPVVATAIGRDGMSIGNLSVTWTSSEPSVVQVQDTKTAASSISGVAVGTATITARLDGTAHTVSMQVQVTATP